MLLGLTTAITPTAEISYGIEALLSPLSPLGFPVAEAGLIATLTFRFIPFLREEGERLAKAQTVRGGDLGYRSRNPFRRIKASLPVMVPLFIGTLRKAETLGESMHLRGYAGTRLGERLHRFTLSGNDIVWLCCSFGSYAAAIWCWFADYDRLLAAIVLPF
jgi:energy-coupling factor transport system permease protein